MPIEMQTTQIDMRIKPCKGLFLFTDVHRAMLVFVLVVVRHGSRILVVGLFDAQ
jgi:hypothetical protein